MSPQDVDDDTEELEDDDPDLVKKLRSQLRAQNKRAKADAEAIAERDFLRRQLAFSQAGIKDEGPAKWFIKAYDGSLDPDEIKKAAIEGGILANGGPPPEELAKHDQLENASAGAARGDISPDVMAEIREAAEGGDRYTSPLRIMEVLRKHGLNKLDVSSPRI